MKILEVAFLATRHGSWSTTKIPEPRTSDMLDSNSLPLMKLEAFVFWMYSIDSAVEIAQPFALSRCNGSVRLVISIIRIPGTVSVSARVSPVASRNFLSLVNHSICLLPPSSARGRRGSVGDSTQSEHSRRRTANEDRSTNIENQNSLERAANRLPMKGYPPGTCTATVSHTQRGSG